MQSEHPLEHFTFTHHTFILQPKEKIDPPYFLGNLLRSTLGMVLRQSICATGQQDCPSCLLYRSCIYAYLFESPIPEDAAIMRKYPSAPHPFVLGFDPRPSFDDKLRFTLTLVGKSVDYLPYFIFATEELGRRGLLHKRVPFTLEMLTTSDQEPAYIPGEKPLATSPQKATELFATVPERVGEATLELVTPLRLRMKNRILTAPSFQDLFRNLLRRIGLLSYFHCGRELELDFRRFIDESAIIETKVRELQWKPLTRRSRTQNSAMEMGGITGRITFQGPITPFLPYLILGEKVHVGRNCSFGLGKYVLEDIT